MQPVQAPVDEPQPSRNASSKGRADRLTEGLEFLLRYILDALRANQPLVVLASLSLVIAAFSQNVSSAAVSDAVGAAVAFLAALIFTTMVPLGDTHGSFIAAGYRVGALLAIAVGFGMLFFVIYDFGARYPLASEFIDGLQEVVALVITMTMALIAWDWRRIIERSSPQPYQQLRSRVEFSCLAISVSPVLQLALWILNLAGMPPSIWVVVVVVALPVPLFFYVDRVRLRIAGRDSKSARPR